MTFLHGLAGLTPPTPLMPAVIQRRPLVAAGLNSGRQFGWLAWMVAVLLLADRAVRGDLHISTSIGFLDAQPRIEDTGMTDAFIGVVATVAIALAFVALKFGLAIGQTHPRAETCAAVVVGTVLAEASNYLLPETLDRATLICLCAALFPFCWIRKQCRTHWFQGESTLTHEAKTQLHTYRSGVFGDAVRRADCDHARRLSRSLGGRD